MNKKKKHPQDSKAHRDLGANDGVLNSSIEGNKRTHGAGGLNAADRSPTSNGA